LTDFLLVAKVSICHQDPSNTVFHEPLHPTIIYKQYNDFR